MRQQKQGFVYILFSKLNGTLYVGVPSDLQKRIYEHKNKLTDSFTKKYNIDKLGYYEVCDSMESAIARKKQLKGKVRAFKARLIYEQNPQWRDLSEDLQ